MNDRDLYHSLLQLREWAVECERRAAPMLERVCEGRRASAVNLVHYLSLRSKDHRALQEELSRGGFSSLGRSESHVMGQLEAVLGVLARLLGEEHHPRTAATARSSQALLEGQARALLGPSPAARHVRVMVTLPSEAAHRPEQVRELMAAGMDLARINTAHDDIDSWRAMANHVRHAARELGRTCLIAVDIAGPKCRTGALEPGPEVLKLKPRRSPWGEVQEPARAWLTAGTTQHSPALPVRASFIEGLRVGDELSLVDARGSKCTLRVEALAAGSAEVACERTAYIRRGTRIQAAHDAALVGPLPRAEQHLLLHAGERLALTRSDVPGHEARAQHEQGHACIPCEPPALLDMIRAGESVWFDDGRIGGVIESVEPERAWVRITSARAEGEKLRAGKGVNLPDTDITLAALTNEDREAVAFAVAEADLVQMSFVRSPEDVRALQDLLTELGKPELGVVLKIETRQAFERLPAILLTAMRRNLQGVMIARGDLAVECGFERLSEVQEEILWFCEAAHVPVIWATQVLETMAKSGRPTRAEVTDAAMAERAECVMLNKGPYIVDTLRILDDILRRMSAHQSKKTSTFRALAVARLFSEALATGAADAARVTA